MAGSAWQSTELAPLARVRSSLLDPILEEEIEDWRTRLHWDYRTSADMVRHYSDMQVLNGFALFSQGEAAGFAYYVVDERKGLIGDLYVRRQWRTAENELRLLGAVVEALLRSPLVLRIESQLMRFESARSAALPYARFAHPFPRNFMLAELEGAAGLPVGSAAGRVVIEPWSQRHAEGAAQTIAAAYVGHVDSEINDQYNSAAGARRFVHNIVEYPGCGNFCAPASFVAFERAAGEACGVCLTSLVAADVGHITQVCVHPRVKGTGVGYELVRRSLVALARLGCVQVSLTVTAANSGAVALYERMGFHIAHRFDALVWSGF